MRIHKVLAAAGVASRRKIEQMIVDGEIYVNAKQATIGQSLKAGDKVTVNGKVINWSADTERQIIIYHKPEGVVCTRSDPEGRPTVFDHLPKLETGRWVAVGRLDINTSGLLIFTTDGALANKYMHPSNEFVREYRVRVYGRLYPETLNKLDHGVELDDGFAKFDTMYLKSADKTSGNNNWFTVTLHSGRNRLVRRLFESQGLEVNRLIRTRFDKYKLLKNLKLGTFEFV
jgi:23S rRNA pseudouridine2605 synthase